MSTQQRIHISLAFAEIAAGTGEDWYVPIAEPGTWKLEKCYFVPWTNETANDTNYTTLSVLNGSTSLGAEATTTADTGNLTAGTPIEIVLTGTGKDLEFSQGGAIHFRKAESGTGLAVDGAFAATLVKVRT